MTKDYFISRNDTSLQSITKEMKENNFRQLVIENSYGVLKLEYEEK